MIQIWDSAGGPKGKPTYPTSFGTGKGRVGGDGAKGQGKGRGAQGPSQDKDPAPAQDKGQDGTPDPFRYQGPSASEQAPTTTTQPDAQPNAQPNTDLLGLSEGDKPEYDPWNHRVAEAEKEEKERQAAERAAQMKLVQEQKQAAAAAQARSRAKQEEAAKKEAVPTAKAATPIVQEAQAKAEAEAKAAASEEQGQGQDTAQVKAGQDEAQATPAQVAEEKDVATDKQNIWNSFEEDPPPGLSKGRPTQSQVMAGRTEDLESMKEAARLRREGLVQQAREADQPAVQEEVHEGDRDNGPEPDKDAADGNAGGYYDYYKDYQDAEPEQDWDDDWNQDGHAYFQDGYMLSHYHGQKYWWDDYKRIWVPF